ncbi:GNAT family N-acetyltransferase [Paraburkholderia phenazinium]|jgi:ribosomal protein S18 acetylase RimI-like enzyme|uniref:GNAT family N-acetyltransferase n=1 Tax=Paraburkholderia phenazinium TaxID=60549 RepID=UPI000B88AC7B|nr:GNAT family N-acetyltransferase [Paraburkholderia phenazinium]
MRSILVSTIDNSNEKIAEEIQVVQYAAYLQEAKLLDATWFPPLERTAADIRRSTDRFFGAYIDEVLIGVASIESSDAQTPPSISSLTVLPQYQRRGAARQLLSTLLAAAGTQVVTVSTGARNEPALALYSTFGFVPFRYRTVGEEQLQLVELKRD